MELITIKNFCEKHSIEDAKLRAILSAFDIKPSEKDTSVKGKGKKPGLFDEATVLRAIKLVNEFT